MSRELSRIMTPRQQLELHSLLGRQVKSYHKHYHMGDNTSVPTEVAQALLQSLWYTLDLGSGESLEERLKTGQAALEIRLEEVRRLYKLVAATAPDFQSQCHWEALDSLGRYLQRYDHLHFAHRIPEELFYPLLAPVPGELQGLDNTAYYLNCLWIENQILHAFPEGAVPELYGHMPPDHWEAPQNLCEQPLINALGRILLGMSLEDSLLVDESGRDALCRLAEESRLYGAMDTLCGLLALSPAGAAYAWAVIPELLPRLRAALPTGDLSYIFL